MALNVKKYNNNGKITNVMEKFGDKLLVRVCHLDDNHRQRTVAKFPSMMVQNSDGILKQRYLPNVF